MSITSFGLVFITLGFTLLAARPAWLFPFLIVSAVLHAFAVVIIGPATLSVGLGISPWLFTCSLIFIHFIIVITRNRRLEFALGASRPLKLLFWGWMVFIGWCVISAFTLPYIFEGTPVHRLSNFGGFDGPLESLVWNRVNAIQAVSAAIIGMLFIYILNIPGGVNLSKGIVIGFILAALLSICISIFHSLEMSGISIPLTFLHQSLNPSYNPGFDGVRAFFPFSESSYSSVWYSALLFGGLVIYIFTQRVWGGMFFIIAGVVGLLISLGGTGLAGSALALLLLFVVIVAALIKGIVSVRHVLLRIVILLAILVALVIAFESAPKSRSILPAVYKSIQSIVQQRATGPISYRGQSNWDAIAITKSTWGLGGGLGSNRASSYLLSMMSNIGLPGIALFLLLATYQTYLLLINPRISKTIRAFVLGGTVAMFSGMTIGIPDLMFPAWWIWLLAGFGAVVASQAGPESL
jgi:hypothetical protein